MTFWTYMLHCRGGAYYVGHTDNLEYRIGQHQSGLIAGYTSERLPVTLVWSQDFPTRIETLEAERRIKGWSRAKKMALIRGDWDRISALAKGKNDPSTSSGRTEIEMPLSPRTVRPEPVEGLSLICHPNTPSKVVERIIVEVGREQGAITLNYNLFGKLEQIYLPEPMSPVRGDRLWEHTCFEAFAKPEGGESYFEFNFDPARRWAIYAFKSYRSSQFEPRLASPRIGVPTQIGSFSISPVIYLEGVGRFDLALSAVIEESDGTKSYWALAHPPGKPDFHHPDCFALTLGAPDAA